MPFFVKLPRHPSQPNDLAGHEHYLNIINGRSTLVQKELRRRGYAGYEIPTSSCLCAVFELLAERKREAAREVRGSDSFVFYDVGANSGLYSFLCKALFEESKVIAFEPAPKTFEWLCAIDRANRLGISPQKLGVSDSKGTATLFLSRRSDASNSLDPNFRRHLGSEQIDLVSLDDFNRDTGLVPDLLKIDTETHEVPVLSGARTLLEKRRPYLVIEVLPEQGPGVSQFMDELGGYHYYHLTHRDGLRPSKRIQGEGIAKERDWLLSPVELDDSFSHRVSRWKEVLLECTADQNIRYGLPRFATQLMIRARVLGKKIIP